MRLQRDDAERTQDRADDTWRTILARIYPIPEALASDEAGQQYVHRDLDGMAFADLERHRRRLALRTLLDDWPSAWLLERAEALEREIARGRRAR